MEHSRKILLVYPQYPDTFWSFKHALKFVSKKAAFPPLGLLTVAAMLPGEWEKKLVDMNVTRLTDSDIKWADYVFISAMVVQRDSVKEVISRCNQLNARIVAGGPLFTTGYEEFDGVDHFVLGEAEVTLSPFLADLEKGQARSIYTSGERPDITRTPIPLLSLINMKSYSSMNEEQVLAELETLHQKGWRGAVFIVDDNFIANKNKLKLEILPAIIEWRKKKSYPFDLFTEASINLADDEKLMKLMVDAGFNMVFVGIETPNEESLVECAKSQNQNRDLVASVRKIQNHGLEVQGGFIVGFDSDPLAIFKNQIDFIQKSGIVTAMVGLLNAPPGTRLYQRLKKENRLIKAYTGNNTDCSLNFIPKMNYEVLINGYKHILSTIYSPQHYYERVRTLLREYNPQGKISSRLQFHHIRALIASIWFLGIREKGRRYYWRLFLSTLLKQPRKFPLSITLSVYGYHFRKVAEKYVRQPLEHQDSSISQIIR